MSGQISLAGYIDGMDSPTILTIPAVLLAAVFAFWLTAAPAGEAPPTNFGQGLAAYDAGDYRAAFDHWIVPAAAGHVDSQIGVAMLYDQGLGRRADPVKSFHWYQLAARAGDALAQISLAEKYEAGLGVAQDRAMAYAWFERAASSGNAHAKRQVPRLAEMVPAAAQAEARGIVGSETRKRKQ